MCTFSFVIVYIVGSPSLHTSQWGPGSAASVRGGHFPVLEDLAPFCHNPLLEEEGRECLLFVLKLIRVLRCKVPGQKEKLLF